MTLIWEEGAKGERGEGEGGGEGGGGKELQEKDGFSIVSLVCWTRLELEAIMHTHARLPSLAYAHIHTGA